MNNSGIQFIQKQFYSLKTNTENEREENKMQGVFRFNNSDDSDDYVSITALIWNLNASDQFCVVSFVRVHSLFGD